MKHTKNIVMLLLTAIIWGFAFCAQSAAMDSIEPLAFNMLRSILGGLVLIPVILFLDKLKSQKDKEIEKSYRRKDLLIGGLCCGVALGTASAMQQIGIKYTTVGKAGFITACYIILVPIFGIFSRLKRRDFRRFPLPFPAFGDIRSFAVVKSGTTPFFRLFLSRRK